jgi:hypothetical protein
MSDFKELVKGYIGVINEGAYVPPVDKYDSYYNAILNGPSSNEELENEYYKLFYKKGSLSQKEKLRLRFLGNKLNAIMDDDAKEYARMTPKKRSHYQRVLDRFQAKDWKENRDYNDSPNADDDAEYKSEIRNAQDPKYKH